jgi:hypothetical protein
LSARVSQVQEHNIRVALKFCGSCNPEIDLSALSRQVAKHVAGGADITIVHPDAPEIDVVIILCGCLRACIDREETRAIAPHHLIVAGESIEGKACKETRLAAAVAERIDRLADQLR